MKDNNIGNLELFIASIGIFCVIFVVLYSCFSISESGLAFAHINNIFVRVMFDSLFTSIVSTIILISVIKSSIGKE